MSILKSITLDAEIKRPQLGSAVPSDFSIQREKDRPRKLGA